MNSLRRTNLLLPPQVIKYPLWDDGIFPNNAKLPLLIYRHVLNLPDNAVKAASAIDKIFEKNDWSNSWRNKMYDYHHYHSNTHEVLGIYSGSGIFQFGGPGGIITSLAKGDAVVIPAGVGHKCVDAGQDFKCVGAYPDGEKYDMNYGKENERECALKNIPKAKFPKADPLYGSRGPLMRHWSAYVKV